MLNSSADSYLHNSPPSPCGSAVSPSEVFYNSGLLSKNIPVSRSTTPKKSLRKRKSATNSKSSTMAKRSFSLCSEDSNPFSASNAETGSDSGKKELR